MRKWRRPLVRSDVLVPTSRVRALALEHHERTRKRQRLAANVDRLRPKGNLHASRQNFLMGLLVASSQLVGDVEAGLTQAIGGKLHVGFSEVERPNYLVKGFNGESGVEFDQLCHGRLGLALAAGHLAKCIGQLELVRRQSISDRGRSDLRKSLTHQGGHSNMKLMSKTLA